VTTPPADGPDREERRAATRAVERSILRATLSVVVIVALYYTLPITPHSDLGAVIRMVTGAVLVAAVAIWEVRAVSRARYPRVRAIDALAVAVTVMVVVFATFYLNLSSRDADAFSEPLQRTTSLYFTMVTLTTVGFGDITARSDGARVAVMVQLVFDVAVIGTTVKLIVETAKRRVTARVQPEP
jgi:voltage-gated potassium channel